MNDRIEPTEKMIQAAMKAGQVTEAIARAMLTAVMEVMPRHYDGPRYPMAINNRHGVGIRKVRIIGTSDQPGYFRIECEDGEVMNLHANEILPTRRPKPVTVDANNLSKQIRGLR